MGNLSICNRIGRGLSREITPLKSVSILIDGFNYLTNPPDIMSMGLVVGLELTVNITINGKLEKFHKKTEENGKALFVISGSVFSPSCQVTIEKPEDQLVYSLTETAINIPTEGGSVTHKPKLSFIKGISFVLYDFYQVPVRIYKPRPLTLVAYKNELLDSSIVNMNYSNVNPSLIVCPLDRTSLAQYTLNVDRYNPFVVAPVELSPGLTTITLIASEVITLTFDTLAKQGKECDIRLTNPEQNPDWALTLTTTNGKVEVRDVPVLSDIIHYEVTPVGETEVWVSGDVVVEEEDQTIICSLPIKEIIFRDNSFILDSVGGQHLNLVSTKMLAKIQGKRQALDASSPEYAFSVNFDPNISSTAELILNFEEISDFGGYTDLSKTIQINPNFSILIDGSKTLFQNTKIPITVLTGFYINPVNFWKEQFDINPLYLRLGHCFLETAFAWRTTKLPRNIKYGDLLLGRKIGYEIDNTSFVSWVADSTYEVKCYKTPFHRLTFKEINSTACLINIFLTSTTGKELKFSSEEISSFAISNIPGGELVKYVVKRQDNSAILKQGEITLAKDETISYDLNPQPIAVTVSAIDKNSSGIITNLSGKILNKDGATVSTFTTDASGKFLLPSAKLTFYETYHVNFDKWFVQGDVSFLYENSMSPNLTLSFTGISSERIKVSFPYEAISPTTLVRVGLIHVTLQGGVEKTCTKTYDTYTDTTVSYVDSQWEPFGYQELLDNVHSIYAIKTGSWIRFNVTAREISGSFNLPSPCVTSVLIEGAVSPGETVRLNMNRYNPSVSTAGSTISFKLPKNKSMKYNILFDGYSVSPTLELIPIVTAALPLSHSVSIDPSKAGELIEGTIHEDNIGSTFKIDLITVETVIDANTYIRFGNQAPIAFKDMKGSFSVPIGTKADCSFVFFSPNEIRAFLISNSFLTSIFVRSLRTNRTAPTIGLSNNPKLISFRVLKYVYYKTLSFRGSNLQTIDLEKLAGAWNLNLSNNRQLNVDLEGRLSSTSLYELNIQNTAIQDLQVNKWAPTLKNLYAGSTELRSLSFTGVTFLEKLIISHSPNLVIQAIIKDLFIKLNYITLAKFANEDAIIPPSGPLPYPELTFIVLTGTGTNFLDLSRCPKVYYVKFYQIPLLKNHANLASLVTSLPQGSPSPGTRVTTNVDLVSSIKDALTAKAWQIFYDPQFLARIPKKETVSVVTIPRIDVTALPMYIDWISMQNPTSLVPLTSYSSLNLTKDYGTVTAFRALSIYGDNSLEVLDFSGVPIDRLDCRGFDYPELKEIKVVNCKILTILEPCFVSSLKLIKIDLTNAFDTAPASVTTTNIPTVLIDFISQLPNRRGLPQGTLLLGNPYWAKWLSPVCEYLNWKVS